MTDLTDLLLTGVVNYGAPALALALLVAASGVPLPSSLLVIAGGAFIRQGLLDPLLAIGLGLMAAVLGDSVSYGMGRFAGGWVERRYGATTLWQGAQNSFNRYGGWSVYLSRWLLTSVAIPVNLVAGSTAYTYRRFLLMVVAGEATWLVLFGGLGYAFGSQWEAISTLISDFGGLVLGLFVLAAGIYLAVRWLRK
jgi:membrane protein DedA with SNARE-associated domain